MTCRKTRYRDRIAAINVLAMIQRTDGPGRPKLERRAYRCPNCRAWHLTSQRRKR